MDKPFNAIRIEDFPETDVVLSSDKLILFDSETFSPILCDVSDLSSIAVLSEIDGPFLENKVNAIVKMAENAKKYLEKNFITKADAAVTYSTQSYFYEQFSKLETSQMLNARLANKASAEDLDEKYNTVKNTINKIKFLLGASAHGKAEESRKWRGYKRIVSSKAAAKEGGEE